MQFRLFHLNAAALRKVEWPCVAAIGVLIATAACFALGVLASTGGRLVYTLDDPYIHMAMAKHAAFDGVWGITRYGFTSSTSSPVWTALLTVLFRIGGDHSWLPFWLNLIAAAGVLAVADSSLRKASLESWARFAALMALILLVPLPQVVFTGMEHSLQILFVLLFLDGISDVASGRAESWTSGRRSAMAAVVAFLPLVRYESMILIAVGAAALVASRRYRQAGLILLLASGPVLLYGALCAGQGWWWLPNSVLVKSTTGAAVVPVGGHGTLSLAAERLLSAWPILRLIILQVPLSLPLIVRRDRRFAPHLMTFVVATSMSLLILVLTPHFPAPWNFRYEAWLMAANIISLATLAQAAASLDWRLNSNRAYLIARLTLPAAAGLVLLGIFAVMALTLGSIGTKIASPIADYGFLLVPVAALAAWGSMTAAAGSLRESGGSFVAWIFSLLAVTAAISRMVGDSPPTRLACWSVGILAATAAVCAAGRGPVVFSARRFAALFILLLFGFSSIADVSGRAQTAFGSIRSSAVNIWQQQWQMARFLRRYYDGSSVALNDIGAVNYFSDLHCLDLVGLADMDVARAKRRGLFDRRMVDRLAAKHDVEVAMVYSSWFKHEIPESWLRVGSWTVGRNVVLGAPTVDFYTRSRAESNRLRTCLAEFNRELPAHVAWSIAAPRRLALK